MHVLVVGAYGFIGRGVVAALRRAGHRITGAGRDLALGRRLVPEIEWLYTDFNEDLDPVIWAERLQALETPVDAVVNCVGILQSDLSDKAARVHGAGAEALFFGAERAGVDRVVHLSATTVYHDEVDRPRVVDTDYGLSKAAGEQSLAATDLNWTIVRPCLVLGEGSQGGALLMRALAGLPFYTPVPAPGTQSFQPIALTDLAEGIVRLVEDKSGAFRERGVYAVGPEVKTLVEIIGQYRSWLGFAPSKLWLVPGWLMGLMVRVGDFVALFGNRTALRRASLEQMAHFREHDPAPFQKLIGRKLQAMSEQLDGRPATFPDRQHARTAFVWPVLQWGLGLSWIFLGLRQLVDVDFTDMFKGAHFAIATGMIIFSSLLSIVAGGLFLSKRWLRLGGLIKLWLVVAASFWGLQYISSVAWALEWGIGVVVSVALILLVMGMSEKR